ncbi:hypothetical protein TNCV_733831 [Trichonephila clavipes]|nr:hypothetical protein TNCV_733831 [Trichonephila clavipes]
MKNIKAVVHPGETSLASSSFKLMGCLTRHLKRSQICSIGDESRDRAGQGRVVAVRRQSCDTLAVGGRALSY